MPSADRSEPVVLLELADDAPSDVLDGVRATALAVLAPPPVPGRRTVVLVDLPDSAEAVARRAAALPGALAVATARADADSGPDGRLALTAWCPACGRVDYWLVPSPLPAP